MRTQRYPGIDFLKGSLIILVCIGHLHQYVVCPPSIFWSSGLTRTIYMFHMPLFIAISGFLGRSGLRREAPGPYVLSKAALFLIPIFVWASVQPVGSLLFGSVSSLWECLRLIFRFAGGSYWFLWVLLVCMLVLKAACMVQSRKVFLALAVGPAVLFQFLPDVWPAGGLAFLYPFFLIGFLVADRAEPVADAMPRWGFIVAALVFGLSFLVWREDCYVYIGHLNFSAGSLQSMAIRFAGGLSASVLAVWLIERVRTRCPLFVQDLVARLGRESLAIYILHMQVIGLLDRFNLRLNLDMPDFVLWIASTALGIALALAVYFGATLIGRVPGCATLLLGRFARPTRSASAAPGAS